MIIDVPLADLAIGKQIFEYLTELASMDQLPIIIITDIKHLDQKRLRASMPHSHFLSCHPIYITEIFHIIAGELGVFPASSSEILEGIQQLRCDHVRHMQQTEYIWVERRQSWLNQRCEWIEQRQTCLEQRLSWINNQREFSDPQLEWLEQQEVWVQQQCQDVKQQRMWIEQLQLWINRYRNRLNQQERPPLSQAQYPYYLALQAFYSKATASRKICDSLKGSRYCFQQAV